MAPRPDWKLRMVRSRRVTWQRRIWFDDNAGKEMTDVSAPAGGVLCADSITVEGTTVMPRSRPTIRAHPR
jgi:hypothetical protein